jgi:hypothetical protein
MKFFAWYAGGDYYPTNTPDSCGYSASGWYEAETPQDAARLAKADGCQWTSVRITKDANTQPYGDNVLAEA